MICAFCPKISQNGVRQQISIPPESQHLPSRDPSRLPYSHRRLRHAIMAPSFDTLSEQDLHEEEEEEVDFSGVLQTDPPSFPAPPR